MAGGAEFGARIISDHTTEQVLQRVRLYRVERYGDPPDLIEKKKVSAWRDDLPSDGYVMISIEAQPGGLIDITVKAFKNVKGMPAGGITRPPTSLSGPFTEIERHAAEVAYMRLGPARPTCAAYARQLAAELRASLAVDATDLTDREEEIIRWLAEGHTKREIVELANLELKTVKSHCSNIKKKLGLSGYVTEKRLQQAARRWVSENT